MKPLRCCLVAAIAALLAFSSRAARAQDAGTSPAAQIKELQQALDRQKERRQKWDAWCKRQADEYRAKWKAYEHSLAALRDARGPARDDSTRDARSAADGFVEAAFNAYIGNPALRSEIRERLVVIVGSTKDWTKILDSLETWMASEGGSQTGLVERFERMAERTRLAEELVSPANREALKAFLADLKASGHRSAIPPTDPSQWTMGDALGLLADLKAEGLRYAAGRWVWHLYKRDPEAGIVHERVALAFVRDEGLDGEYLTAFEKQFEAWMRAASPDHEVRAGRYHWTHADALAALTRAEELVETDPANSPRPNCDDSVASQLQPRAALEALMLCDRMHRGLILVEVRGTKQQATARVSWRIGGFGRSREAGDEFPGQGMAVTPHRDAGTGKYDGQRFALRLLRESTIFKGVRGILELLEHEDAEKLLAMLKEQGGHVAPPVPPPPPDPPLEIRPSRFVLGLSALASPAVPWLSDEPRDNDDTGVVLGWLDFAALAVGVAAGGAALALHQGGRRGDEAMMHVSAGAFGTALVLRLGSWGAYAWPRAGTDTDQLSAKSVQ